MSFFSFHKKLYMFVHFVFFCITHIQSRICKCNDRFKKETFYFFYRYLYKVKNKFKWREFFTLGINLVVYISLQQHKLKTDTLSYTGQKQLDIWILINLRKWIIIEISWLYTAGFVYKFALTSCQWI